MILEWLSRVEWWKKRQTNTPKTHGIQRGSLSKHLYLCDDWKLLAMSRVISFTPSSHFVSHSHHELITAVHLYRLFQKEQTHINHLTQISNTRNTHLITWVFVSKIVENSVSSVRFIRNCDVDVFHFKCNAITSFSSIERATSCERCNKHTSNRHFLFWLPKIN